jgi:hypothetical protein
MYSSMALGRCIAGASFLFFYDFAGPADRGIGATKCHSKSGPHSFKVSGGGHLAANMQLPI